MNGFEKKCVICGITEGLELDHIIPISKGGTDNPENMQWLCRKHNQEKRDKTSYYNFDKEIMEKMILESLEFDFDPYLNGAKIDPIKAYHKVSKVFFILPKDFYDIYTKWKKAKEIKLEKEITETKENIPNISKEMSNVSKVKHILDELTIEIGENIPIETINKRCECIKDLHKTIKKMSDEGLIFYPRTGIIRKVI